MFDIEITNCQSAVSVDENRLEQAIVAILQKQNVNRARISVSIVDDPTIHQLNRQWLDHDYATDVLSFPLSWENDFLEGEVVASGDTAKASASRFSWRSDDELLLYVVHGTLHLVGYDDHSPEDLAEMRQGEREILALFDLHPNYDAIEGETNR